MLHALERKEIKKGDVVVIRYGKARRAPGMPEMLTPTSRSWGAGLGKDVALMTDGRFSGGSHGFIIAMWCRRRRRRSVALIQDGGIVITIDATETTERGCE